ncbi:MAG: acyl-CoA thioesterase [Pseudomonadota bacterium]
MKLESTVVVTAEYIDDLGHMNHALGLRLFEFARDEWYAKAGLWEGRPWSDDEHLGTIVLNLNVNYRRECFLDEELTVSTEPLKRGRKSYVLKQEMRKADGTVALDLTTTCLIMDMRERKTIEIPASLARHFPAAT